MLLLSKLTNRRNNLVHKFSPMLQAMRIPDAKAAVEKEWEKLEKILAWQLTKVRNKNEVIDEARNEGRNSSFCRTDGHLSFEECRIGGKSTKNTMAESYCEATL